MKRSLAVVGFSMLFSSLLLNTNSSERTITVFMAVLVLFGIFMLFKRHRKSKTVLLSLFAVMLFCLCFGIAQSSYHDALKDEGETVKIEATVCQNPNISDYAYTYTLKVNQLNGEKVNFKIRYISESKECFSCGDIVSGNVMLSKSSQDYDSSEYYLASKIYFTSYKDDESTLVKQDGINELYYVVGCLKNYFANMIRNYLPGENGAIALAMVIGDRDGIERRTQNAFNCSGASHLLVVSGLHLTLWALGITRFMNKFSKMRKFTLPIGFLMLFFYCALTGFSVSVMRAAAMVGAVLLGNVFIRGADSLNSIGFVLTVMLTANPFCAYSAALWLSVFSTSAILLFSEKTYEYIKNLTLFKWAGNSFVFDKAAVTASISIPVTILTLPIIIVKFNMFPILSVISNFVMVTAAEILMILTVAGMILNLLHLSFLTEGVYFLAGLLSEFMKRFALKTGEWEYSTVSVSHKAFRYFLIFALAVFVIAFVLRHKFKNVFKHTAVIISISLIFVCLYAGSSYYSTPCIDLIADGGKIYTLVNFKGENMLVNCFKYDFLDEVNSRNKKNIDTLVITENPIESLKSASYLKRGMSIDNIVFCKESPDVYLPFKFENVTGVYVGRKIYSDFSNSENYIEINFEKRKILILISNEKDFENTQDYDTIIMNTKTFDELSDEMTVNLQNSDAEIILLNDGEKTEIYL